MASRVQNMASMKHCTAAAHLCIFWLVCSANPDMCTRMARLPCSAVGTSA